MAFFLRSPTLPAGFVSKLLFPLRKQRDYPTHSNYKANRRHLKVLSIPHVFEIAETIMPIISRSILASSVLSTVEIKTVIGKVTTAWSQPAAGAASSVGAGAHPNFSWPVLQVRWQTEQWTQLEGGRPSSASFLSLPQTEGTGVAGRCGLKLRADGFRASPGRGSLHTVLLSPKVIKRGRGLEEKGENHFLRETGLNFLSLTSLKMTSRNPSDRKKETRG